MIKKFVQLSKFPCTLYAAIEKDGMCDKVLTVVCVRKCSKQGRGVRILVGGHGDSS